MTIKPWITQAGRYPVARISCPLILSVKMDLDAPRSGVLHTTEGGWEGSMDVFRRHWAPHFIVGLHNGKPQIAQLVPVGTIGAACVAHNDHAIVQIEMVAFCKTDIWLPDAGTLDALASLMLVCRDEWGIPLSHPWKDGDFGKASDNPHRHAGFYGKTPGWFGHGDMPCPDSHFDPGALAWSKVFAHAHSLDAPPPPAKPVPVS